MRWFLAFCVVVGLACTPTSDEMEELRAVEATLDLPEPIGRTEDDSGESTDYKGAQHNRRYILLYYGSNLPQVEIAAAFDREGWSLVSETNDSGETRWRYANADLNACASVWLDDLITGDISDSGVFLNHASSDACSGLSSQ